MKKKYLILIIVLLIALVITGGLIFFATAKINVDKLINTKYDNLHATLWYRHNSKEENVDLYLNPVQKSVQYENQAGTYVYIVKPKALLLLEKDETSKKGWYVDIYPVLESNQEDLSQIYNTLLNLLKQNTYKATKEEITLRLNENDVYILKNILNIIASEDAGDIEKNDEWDCTYKINENQMTNFTCQKNNQPVLKISFDQFNSIDKEKLLKVYMDLREYE